MPFERQKSRRISVSTRNVNRMHSDFHDDQDRLNQEKAVLREKQKARTREKLRKKRSFARKQGKVKRKSMKRKTKTPHPPADDISETNVVNEVERNDKKES